MVEQLRVAIYIRVSTKLQEHKFSLKAQTEELKRYAEQMGWIVVNIFKDVDSGGKLDKNGLNSLLDAVEEDKVDVVLCIDQDRLSRLDTIAWEYLKSTLRDNGVKIAEPGNIVDLTNEDDEFISDIKNLIARREKKAIVRRMMRGKRQRTREGKGWGKPPWEYDYDKNTSSYSINEKLAWIIPFIDDLYLGEEGLSDTNIAVRLTEVTKTPSGKAWDSQHILQRLTSKLYHGVMVKEFSNGETITVENVYPPLRSEETWVKIQAKRKEKYQRRDPVHPHILRNINTTCGNCGKKLTLKQSGTSAYSIHYYFVHGREHKPTYSPGCGMSINSIRIEYNIITTMRDVLESKEKAGKYIQFEFGEDIINQLTVDISALNTLLQTVQQKIDNLLDLYLDGGFTKEVLNTKKNALENERGIHSSKKSQLEAKKAAILAKKFNWETVEEYLAFAKRFDVELTEHEKMVMIGIHFPTGTLYEDRYVLQGDMAGVPFDIDVPVAANPFGYMNSPGKRKPRRITKSSLGMEKLTKENKRQLK